jgi:aspartate aminotransferase
MSQRATALKARGVRVFDFSIGEPDQATPAHIRAAASAALENGHTRYTPSGGLPELREAVAYRYKKDFKIGFAPEEVAITTGGKHALYAVCQALLERGDEVVIPSPFWPTFSEAVRLAGARPILVPALEKDGFQITARMISKATSRRTKAVVLNSPNNPTGAVFSPDTLEAVARLAVERDLLLVSDECYEPLSYEGRHTSPASFGPEVKARTLVVNTCSKAYAMTGWRVGYAAGPRELIRAMTDVQSQVTSNPASIAQYAAVEALTGPQDDVAKMAGEFDRRRRLIVEGLNALPGVRCTMPRGAFYAFANVSGLRGRVAPGGARLGGSVDVTAFLLEHARVAVVPGVDFGSDAHVRLSYATGADLIREGLTRMQAAIGALG